MASGPRHYREGVIAGLIGAAIVAVWFLVYDAARGRPFRTPALLGAAAFRGVNDPAAIAPSSELIVQYTVLHGVVFALIGLLVGYLIMSAQREPGRLLTLFLVLVSFEIFFLALLVFFARTVLGELAWWAILVANALAAAGMLTYLLIRHRGLTRGLLGPWVRIAKEGALAGILGAAAVAVWFLLYDLAAGMPLRTPALLGAAVLHGVRDPSAVVVSAPLVLEYTLVHGLTFVAFGCLAAAMLAWADREPRLLFAFVMLFCCFEVFFGAMITVLAEWLFETLAWWTILVGNVLAATAMLGFFFRHHRPAWRAFLHAES